MRKHEQELAGELAELRALYLNMPRAQQQALLHDAAAAIHSR